MVYAVPTSLDEALALARGGHMTICAGGTDLYPATADRALGPDVLDLSSLADLRGIAETDRGFRIGAMTRWADLAYEDLPPAFDALRQAARHVGGVQIQNAGTVGGNLCNASPAADGMPPLLTLEARVELSSTAGNREVPLADFVTGVRRTGRRTDEIVTAILVPPPPEDAGSAFEKLGARRYLVISVAMVAALVRTGGDGRIDLARIAVGACSPVARRLTALEGDVIGQRPAEVRVSRAHLAELAPIEDARGTETFRLAAAAELCRRAIARAGIGRG